MAVLDEKFNYKKIKTNRGSGILLHISSLPGPFGIGALGQEARDFADFLQEAGQKFWQMLPVGPTGYGDSPYASFSSFAGNPYFIDLRDLFEKNLLTRKDLEEAKAQKESFVNYENLYNGRFNILKKAYRNFNIEDQEFNNFIKEKSSWLYDYSLFMAIKDKMGGQIWTSWPEGLKFRKKEALEKFYSENKDEVYFYYFIQYIFLSQWTKLKDYVNSKNIKIIGDLPIYVAEDSADIWANPKMFMLKEDLSPIFVGGCPPDGFSDDGQLWGNPVYNWEANEKDNFSFWVSRIKNNFEIFDCIRLDHFRGFESFWSIPAGDINAKRGTWVKGPGIKLFNKIKEKLGIKFIIAEDLGYMTEEVYKFREATGFPSMKVLQFAFNPDAKSDYLNHNLEDNTVIYTGTHDNDTIVGWVNNTSQEELDFASLYYGISKEEGYNFGLIRAAMTSPSFMAIFQMQDLLFLDNSARMNNPGRLGGNWTWRLEKNYKNRVDIKRFRELTRISGRL